MNKLTEAVFRDGVLRPIEPLQIAENETVRILVLPQCTSPDASASGPLTLQEVDAILREIDAMPDLPSEPRENVAVEHDRYLYGDKSKFACLVRNRRVGDR